MLEYVAPLLIIALLIVLNGLFVAAEFAIVAARAPRLGQGGDRESWGVRFVRRILARHDSQDRYIAIAQLGITLATIGLGMYGEPSLASWIYGPVERLLGVSEATAHSVGTVLAVLTLTYFHVVVGEMIPKAIALQAPERTAVRVARPMGFMGIVFHPLVALLNGTGSALLRLFRIPNSGESRLYTSSELLHLVEESHAEGTVSEEEERLIRNILDFGEREVRHVMVPRPRVEALSIRSKWQEVRDFIEGRSFSRYPVYRSDLDQIVGILHVKDFIAKDVAGEQPGLGSLVRRVPRVPEAMPLERLLALFKRLHAHMALVLDEHGGTSGIVTLDDLLAEVVGEVEDVFVGSERSQVEPAGGGRFLVEGSMPLHHFNEHFDSNLASMNSTTVAGYVLERLKRVPSPGDVVEAEGLSFEVSQVDGLAISRLTVARDSGSGKGEPQ